MNPARDLRTIEVFADLDDESLRWLAEHARFVALDSGEALIREGEPTRDLVAVLEGEIHMRRENGTPDGPLIVRTAGKVTGMLPSSRLTHSPVTARATAPTRVALFSTESFPEMLRRIPVLQDRLASVMVDRAREFSRHDEQREKLVSLGKLSAGLAHELNNPAAAIQRRVDELTQRISDLSAMARSRLEREATPALVAPLQALHASTRASGPPVLDAFERSDAEEAFTAWLEARHLPNAWLAAETFVSAGVSVPALGEATRGLPEGVLRPAVQWLEADLASHRLVEDIAEATRRIVELIAAVKSYSNMDRAPDKRETDVHEGIRSTLAMLTHKLRDKQVVVETQFDPALPRVTANPGELNQVWTNLIDNAIDALPPGGEIVVRTRATEAGVIVQVIDNGAGIADEIKRRIFEPFFTTKDVGEGSGLGLDVVRRIVQGNGADVHVESTPGRTCFEVRFRV